MDIKELKASAFRSIQKDPVLYKKWHEVRTQEERNDMILEIVCYTRYADGNADGYSKGYDDGYANGRAEAFQKF